MTSKDKEEMAELVKYMEENPNEILGTAIRRELRLCIGDSWPEWVYESLQDAWGLIPADEIGVERTFLEVLKSKLADADYYLTRSWGKNNSY